jgi:NAD(P)-dependent dehydrogenase (short-subunit alcohol dehydrogenase family)
MSTGRASQHSTLAGKIVVITGASSGIGRATALRFADEGCQLVLAARREAALLGTAALCVARGARAEVVVTDITSPPDVMHLVDETLRLFGRIDVWVNNAGTTMFGRLHEGEFEQHRQVLETNLLGPMFVSRLVSPIFHRQQFGMFINVGSLLSEVGQPFVPAYVISKFGLYGLSETLRTEFADEPDVHVCTVLPYAVDTPHFQDAANVLGRRIHAMPPVQNPEQVADAIVSVAARPRRRRYVPRYAVAGLVAHWLWPQATEQLLRHALERFHLTTREAPQAGNLFAPTHQSGSVHGVRGPVVPTAVFAAWVGAELLRMGGSWLFRRSPRPRTATW